MDRKAYTVLVSYKTCRENEIRIDDGPSASAKESFAMRSIHRI